MAATMTLPILAANPRLVILDKPAGLPSHAGPRGGPSVEDWFPRLSRRRDGPWLAHRLDADTAGCLAVALRRTALLEAQAAFAAGTVRKTYWAVVQGRPPQPAGTIDLPLRKVTTPDGWRMQAGAGGQAARTDWRLRGAADGLSWLELQPRTGRTHQVRVHCAALGCPVLGDPIYGGGNGHYDGTGTLHLLARALILPAPLDLAAQAPAPAHMRAALRECGAPD
jgi:tRNA pseudouridine32 synthase/23S rRNA pseudouridine746 synthase